MTPPSFDISEKHQSQVPAVQMLVALGFKPLSQAAALALRGGRARNVILDDVLTEQLLKINRFTHRGREYAFDLADAQEAARRLKLPPDKIRGLRGANQDIYDTLVLGTAVEKIIDGDSRGRTMRYIDWGNPENNAFHVTAEFTVERAGGRGAQRCDIVAFVNGVPFIIIENKAPDISLKKAESQLIRYQQADGIPHLFHFAQILFSMRRSEARYAAVGAPKNFWHIWRDREDDESAVGAAANQALSRAAQDEIFTGDFTAARAYFEDLAAQGPRMVTAQDHILYALCRPERLLDITRRFTVFDGSVRKIARYQQFFSVRAALKRVKQVKPGGAREGGVIWHTQGSGKSLTMVMLARALALDPEVENSRIIIVTDRDDLDKQIKDTFKSCDMEPRRASSGADLLNLIRSKAPLITAIVNKFETAAARSPAEAEQDNNIFVLVDESHRTQTGKYGGHSWFAGRMRRILPRACYLGFTGTPLMKKDRSTAQTFGGVIDKYTIDEAVRDGAVVPLLYEGRIVEQSVNADAGVDEMFESVSRGLSDNQQADLKKRFAGAGVLAGTAPGIRAKAQDISDHYSRHWQGSGFKAQLAAPSKAAAVLFKQALDEIGAVSSAIIISPPDDRESAEDVDETDKDSADAVKAFWAGMMETYKNEAEYNRRIIEAFKGPDGPEILIVVSKLLTGFDAPRNTVLYICRPLKDHNLLQAVARVNRVYEDESAGKEKQFGFIIDYEGLLENLDQALTAYSALENYDEADITGAVHDVRAEIGRLSQRRGELWGVFRAVANKQDTEAMERFLEKEPTRHEFYECFRAFSRCLHIAVSSARVSDVFSDEDIAAMKQDWRNFSRLRRSVRIRYQEAVDWKEFAPKMQLLLDGGVSAAPAAEVVEQVNINDEAALAAVLAERGISDASKADRIASAARRVITERMEQDPAFYRRFTSLLEQTMDEYRARRFSEQEYLKRIKEHIFRMQQRGGGGGAFPAAVKHDPDGQAFFGVLDELLANGAGAALSADDKAEIALALISIIKARLIVDWRSNELTKNGMIDAIEDYFFEVVRDQKGVTLPDAAMDRINREVMALAQARFSE